MGMQTLGIPQVSRRLRGISKRARDLTPVWPSVGDELSAGMAAQFGSGGAAGGAAWAPLKPDYLKWKVAHGFPADTLIRTGELMESLTSRPMSVESYGATSAEFGTDDDKYKYHHFGTRHMAQRRALMWFEPVVSRVVHQVTVYIVRGQV